LEHALEHRIPKQPVMASSAQKRSVPQWVRDLRRGIRLDNGKGWSVKLPQGRTAVQVQRIFSARERQYCNLPAHIQWSQADSLTIRTWVKDLHTLMEEHNLSLDQAVERRLERDDSSPLMGETAFTDEGWKATAKEFLDSLSNNRPTTRILAERLVKRAVKSLTTKPTPRNSEALLRRYAQQHFYDEFGNVKTPAGGVERRRSLQEVKRFLEFADRERNAPMRYLPTKNQRLELELIGKSAVTTKQKRTVPV